MQEPDFYIGKPVTSLQAMLRVIATADQTLPTVIPDGIYGDQTRRCVQAFQQQKCLSPTGVADYATWRAVVESFMQAQVECRPAAPLQISMSPGQALRVGSRDPSVLLLQAVLHTLHQAYGSLCDCEVCGVFTEETAAAIRAVQQAADIEQTGCCDKHTWRLLCGLYPQAAMLCRAQNGAAEPEPLPEADRSRSPHADETLYRI